MHFTDLFTTTYNQDVTIHCFLPFCSGLGSLAHWDIDSDMPWIRCFIAFLGLKYSWTYDEIFYFNTTSRQSYVYCLNMYSLKSTKSARKPRQAGQQQTKKTQLKMQDREFQDHVMSLHYNCNSLYTFCCSNMKFTLIFILKLLVFVVVAPKAKFSAIIAYNLCMHATSDPG